MIDVALGKSTSQNLKKKSQKCRVRKNCTKMIHVYPDNLQ